MGNTETDRRSSLLWDRILGSLEEDLAERRARKLVVQGRGESGPYEREIGEFSAAERRSLDPVLGEHVAEQLLDRYLAEKGYVELIDKSYAYRKKIGDLTPADLPALVEAERERIEERRERHERAKFVQDMRAAVDQLQAGELAEMAEAPRSRRVALDGGVDRGVACRSLAWRRKRLSDREQPAPTYRAWQSAPSVGRVGAQARK